MFAGAPQKHGAAALCSSLGLRVVSLLLELLLPHVGDALLERGPDLAGDPVGTSTAGKVAHISVGQQSLLGGWWWLLLRHGWRQRPAEPCRGPGSSEGARGGSATLGPDDYRGGHGHDRPGLEGTPRRVDYVGLAPHRSSCCPLAAGVAADDHGPDTGLAHLFLIGQLLRSGVVVLLASSQQFED